MAVEEAFGSAIPKMNRNALFFQEFLAEGIDLDVWFDQAIKIAKMEEQLEELRHKAEEKNIRATLTSMTLRQLRHQVGELDQATQERILALTNPQLEELGEALLDFKSVEELQTWLQQHSPPERSPVLN